MKIIYSIVDSCRDCPYLRNDTVMGGPYCAENPLYSNIEIDGIPDWCPLEDAPDVAAAEARRDAAVDACRAALEKIAALDPSWGYGPEGRTVSMLHAVIAAAEEPTP